MHTIEYINRETKRNGGGEVKGTDVSTAVRLDKSKLIASREYVISLCDYDRCIRDRKGKERKREGKYQADVTTTADNKKIAKRKILGTDRRSFHPYDRRS